MRYFSTLRNVAVTAPYMHNGEFLSLREVISFYNAGGVSHQQLSPLISKLDLSSSEIDSLVAFLESLTSNRLEVLVADAFAAEVGDEDGND